MADAVIAVRVPRTLIVELKERTVRDHYGDLSEQVRSIVRKACLRYNNPVTHELQELKGQLRDELLKANQDLKTHALIASLKELLSEHDASSHSPHDGSRGGASSQRHEGGDGR